MEVYFQYLPHIYYGYVKFSDNQPDVKRKMQNVEYSSRFALGLFYDKKNEIDIPWTAKYIEGHSCIRFISIDNKKRNAGRQLL